MPGWGRHGVASQGGSFEPLDGLIHLIQTRKAEKAKAIGPSVSPA